MLRSSEETAHPQNLEPCRRARRYCAIVEKSMKIYATVAFSMLAGFGFGVLAINGLNAQGKPGADGVDHISEVADPTLLRQQLLPLALRAPTRGSRLVIAGTDDIVALCGTAAERFILHAVE